jgi:hypothetical protein
LPAALGLILAATSTWTFQRVPRLYATMDDGMSAFARLPIELIHHIFHFASAASRRSCLSLCRVASWARHIALPHLLHTVVVKDRLADGQFHHYFAWPPHMMPVGPSFRLMRNVWIEAPQDCIITFFNACDNIEHLALTDEALFWLIHFSTPALLSSWSSARISDHALTRNRDLHVTMISAGHHWIPLGYIYFARISSLWSKITHIRLADTRVPYPTPQHLSYFTRLSHLAVSTLSIKMGKI